MNKLKALLARLLVCVLLIGVCLPVTTTYAATLSISAADAANHFKSLVGQYSGKSCLAFVARQWEALGATFSSACCARNYGESNIQGTDINNIPLGADVYFASSSSSCSSCNRKAGHVGVYVGDGMMVHTNWGSSNVQLGSVAEIGASHTFMGWGYHKNVSITDGGSTGGGSTTPEVTSGTYLHIDSPVATTYTGDIEIKGWVISDKDISYAMAQVNNVSQYNLELYDSEDINSVYTQLPYRKRFRGVISIGQLSSNTNYEFFAWVGFADGSTVNTSSVTFTTGTVTPSTYTITYNANGGSGAPESQTKTQSVDMLLSPAIPTRFGYNFLGWSTSSTATVQEYMPGDPYVADASLYLYAVWKSAEVIDASLSKRDIPIDPPEIGWNATFKFTPADTTQYRFETSGEKDTWVRIKNTSGTLLASDDNSGTSNNAKLSHVLNAGTTYYIEVGLNADYGAYGLHFTRSWPLTLDPSGGVGGGTFYQYYGGSLKFTHIPTLGHTITLDPDGGTVANDELTVSAELLGWSTAPGSSEIAYEIGSTYAENKARTVYAVWSTPTLGEIETPVRDGFIFGGWMTPDGEIAGADMAVSSDMTLTAQWTADVTDSWKDVSWSEAVNTGDGSVYLEWTDGGEADTYTVYELIGGTRYLVAETSSASCTLTEVDPGVHEYCVRPARGDEKGNYSESIFVDAAPLAVTVYLTGDSAMAQRPLPAEFDAALGSDVDWTSSRLSVAVAANGIVTGKQAGETVISALCEKYTLRCAVTVVEPALIRLPSDVKRIPEQAFLNDLSVEGVMTGDGLTAIADEAFKSCAGMQIIRIGAGVTEIADSAFDGCGNLTICCQKGSAAEQYAIDHGIDYYLIP